MSTSSQSVDHSGCLAVHPTRIVEILDMRKKRVLLFVRRFAMQQKICLHTNNKKKNDYKEMFLNFCKLKCFEILRCTSARCSKMLRYCLCNSVNFKSCSHLNTPTIKCENKLINVAVICFLGSYLICTLLGLHPEIDHNDSMPTPQHYKPVRTYKKILNYDIVSKMKLWDLISIVLRWKSTKDSSWRKVNNLRKTSYSGFCKVIGLSIAVCSGLAGGETPMICCFLQMNAQKSLVQKIKWDWLLWSDWILWCGAGRRHVTRIIPPN